ncbi:uncharacterized protein PAC_06363 [Phialocephala subalpina]|uniref:Uncharacterized protein n=1 Tax=Phialocephala subalpina TaxID=576137 RepID=A0A1L7WUL8_9HELO|nr:uncharacterized protein PAC_06363 [Phialocephala subalpina]
MHEEKAIELQKKMNQTKQVGDEEASKLRSQLEAATHTINELRSDFDDIERAKDMLHAESEDERTKLKAISPGKEHLSEVVGDLEARQRKVVEEGSTNNDLWGKRRMSGQMGHEFQISTDEPTGTHKTTRMNASSGPRDKLLVATKQLEALQYELADLERYLEQARPQVLKAQQQTDEVEREVIAKEDEASARVATWV